LKELIASAPLAHPPQHQEVFLNDTTIPPPVSEQSDDNQMDVDQKENNEDLERRKE
jgi:hypothetical protein